VSRRHFGTGAEVSGQFGPKTLRRQDISALVSGHFGTRVWILWHWQNAAETVLGLALGNNLFKDTQGHRYYIQVQGHPRSLAMSPLDRAHTISYIAL